MKQKCLKQLAATAYALGEGYFLIVTLIFIFLMRNLWNHGACLSVSDMLNWGLSKSRFWSMWLKLKSPTWDTEAQQYNRSQDDVIIWKHFPRYWPFVQGVYRSPVNSTHKGQWCGALMFSLICAFINDWVNNHGAGDLRRLRPHQDINVMVTVYTVAIAIMISPVAWNVTYITLITPNMKYVSFCSGW